MKNLKETILILAKRDNITIDEETLGFVTKFIVHSLAGTILNLRVSIKTPEKFEKFGDIARRDADKIRDFLVQLRDDTDK